MLKNHLKTLKQTLILLIKKPFYLVVPILWDIVFLLFVGFFGNYFLILKAGPILEKVALLKGGSSVDSILTQQMQLTPLTNQILWIFMQFFIVILILMIIFKGINWFLALRCCGVKADFKKYVLNFSIMSILWFLVNIIIGIIFLKLFMRISQQLTALIVIILFLINCYFLFIGYVIGSEHGLKEICKKTILTGIKDFKKIFWAYFVIIVLFAIVNYILRLFSLIGFGALMIAGFILVMPLVVYSRVYLVGIMEEK